MPVYHYNCSGRCGGVVLVSHRMAEPPPKRCPECGARGKKWTRVFGCHTTGLAEPKTFAEQSDQNIRRVGEEGMKRIAAEQDARLRGVGNRTCLPKGAKPIPRENTPVDKPWGTVDHRLNLNNKAAVTKYIQTGEV